jgi:hypothetical protein
MLDVTPMFTYNTDDDLSFYMYRTFTDGKRDSINIKGHNSDGATGDIIITPEFGFGAHYNSKIPASYVDENNQVQTDIIDITLDDGFTQSQITIPEEVSTFDFTYFRTQDGSSVQVSYYVDVNDVMFPFSLENTPISNFSSQDYITINGKSVYRTLIKEISFGDTYKSLTSLPYNFLYRIENLEKINLRGLKNVTNISLYTFQDNLGYYKNLKELDFSVIDNIEFIGDNGFSNFDVLEKLNISTITLDGTNKTPNLFFYWAPSLKDLQIGSIDWSTKTTGSSNFVQNNNSEECILRADSQEIATKWKQKYGMFSNWTVVINPT